MSVPILDLALLRNRILVGATIAILIEAGTINGLMYLLSLYFQDPAPWPSRCRRKHGHPRPPPALSQSHRSYRNSRPASAAAR